MSGTLSKFHFVCNRNLMQLLLLKHSSRNLNFSFILNLSLDPLDQNFSSKDWGISEELGNNRYRQISYYFIVRIVANMILRSNLVLWIIKPKEKADDVIKDCQTILIYAFTFNGKNKSKLNIFFMLFMYWNIFLVIKAFLI